jgi:predicted methyltransferase
VNPANWFDMSRVWAAVQTVRADQRFRPGSPVAVVQVSNPSRDEERRAQDLIRFFGIPPADAQRFHGPELWTKLLSPFVDELAYAINYEKPREIPGKVKFQVGNDGSFWLAYVE